MPETQARDLLETLLGKLATDLEAAGLGVPARRFVHPGDVPAYDFGDGDCSEALILSVRSFRNQVPGSTAIINPLPAPVPQTLDFSAHLVRCVATVESDGSAPSASEIHADGLRALTDGLTLLRTIRATWRSVCGTCDDLRITQVALAGPQGGVVAVRADCEGQLT